MSGEIKVTYFNSKGRTEVTRLLLKLAKKPFVDCRVEGEEWQKLKPCKSFTDYYGGQYPPFFEAMYAF